MLYVEFINLLIYLLFLLNVLGQLLLFISDLAVPLFWNCIRANVHTAVLLGK